MTRFHYLIVILALMGLVAPVTAQVVPNAPAGDLQALHDEAPLFSADGSELSLDPTVSEQVLFLLSGYEYFPTAGDLLALASTPEVYLLSLAYDPGTSTLAIHRHRAVGALAYFPSELTRSHLLYMLHSPATPEMTRHHVLNALARGFGDQALPAIEPFLASNDLQLQLTAVAAIGSIESEAAGFALENALPRQSHELVRERIQEQLLKTPPSDLR